MIVSKVYDIESTDDIELGIKRESLLNFRLTYDDEKMISAIVCIVPGLGEDATDSYKEHLAEYVAGEFGVAVISPNYHCIGNRPQTGAKYVMDEFDQGVFKQLCDQLGITFDFDLGQLCEQETLRRALISLDDVLTARKEKGELNDDFKLGFPVTMEPTRGEYQNFGVMQAVDVINSILYVRDTPPISDFKGLPVIIIGNSHGGYIAHMAAKFAPWLVDGVIDNSAYAKYPWRFVGLGKWVDYAKFSGFSSTLIFKNLVLYGSDKTFWRIDRASPNYFSEANEEIRFILNSDHLRLQSRYPKPIYVSYHCIIDHLAPLEEKVALYRELKELGFDATLNEIRDEKQLDGKFLKKLTHGMDMSIKTLITKELPVMMSKIESVEKQPWGNESIGYASHNVLYKFTHEDGKLKLEVFK